jgi:DNA repair exonuclease SbcCD nuclease subunit
MIIAGDLFDHPRISNARLHQVIGALARAEVPILLLPGNHDPTGPCSLWERREWKQAPARLIRLTDREPVRLTSLRTVIHPCPVGNPMLAPTTELAGRLEANDPSWIEIAVAHGPMRIGSLPSTRPTIDLSQPAWAAMDYVALGDWHGLRLELSNGRLLAAYPGTPETLNHGERESGKALIIDLEPGTPARATAIPVATLVWHELALRVDTPQDVNDLAARLGAIEHPQHAVVVAMVRGAPTLLTLSLLDQLERELEGRFASLRIMRDELRLRIELHELLELIPDPDGPVGRAVATLAKQLDQTPTERRAIEQALRLVYELIEQE